MSESQPFRFLDLSAELRNEIYELLLKHPRAIKLCKSIRVIMGAGDRIFHVESVCISGHFQDDRDSCKNVTLLRSCRQIHAEAAPVLYGNNILTVDKDPFCSFLKQIGPSIQLLRHVTIGFSTKTWMRPMLVSLKKATHLDRLQIEYPARSVIGDANRMAKELGPWARAFHKTRKASTTQGERSTLDVLEFPPKDFGAGQGNDAAVVGTYSAAVKAELRKTLKD